jgi:hypothetical protein
MHRELGMNVICFGAFGCGRSDRDRICCTRAEEQQQTSEGARRGDHG